MKTFYISLLIIISGLVLVCTTFGQKTKIVKNQEIVPRIEQDGCALEIPKSEKVECGHLIVYENRKSSKKRTIKLPFIVMKSDSDKPLPDPILYTAGGPGGSSLRQVRNRQYIPYLKNRDYILFEQRGTKYAQPSLECPQVNAALLNAVKQNFSKTETTNARLKAVQLCREQLQTSEIDLSAYNSAASAADIEDLRELLGYKKWNLYGVSYSTRLMLSVMRYFPNGVRSVLLDSVLPPSVNYDETSVDGLMRSLNLLFAACQDDAKCSAAYPNLEKQFYALVQTADEKPFSVNVKASKTGTTTNLLIGGSDIVNSVYDALENGYMLASVPSLIAKATENDQKVLQTIAELKLNSSSFALGMRYSVWCSEEMPFQNRKSIKKQIMTDYPKLKGFGVQSDFPAICDVWKVRAADKVENEAVKSNIPTLILAGEYDPDTPPSWGKLAAKTLSKSYFFELPAMSHVPTFGSNCAQELAMAFFDNPQNPPNSECISKTGGLQFKIK